MQTCAEKARGQLPYINGKRGDYWDIATYVATAQL
jgi:hypothetical protein